MGIITAEALYPAAYRTDQNTISDLGGTEPPDSIVLQPSAAIFDATMVVTGLMIIVAAVLVRQGAGRRAAAIPTGLLGAGILGVGIFPGNTSPHPYVALLAFAAGGAAGIASARVAPAPLRYVFAGFGVTALASLAAGLFLLDWAPVAALGEGGIERWIAYPVVLWLVGFGTFLASTPSLTATVRDVRSRAGAPLARGTEPLLLKGERHG
jgi:hypothetical membrane protein